MYDKLMIVAHPDDESIFGGIELLKEQGWKVVCVTNGNNKVRAKEFHNAMKFVEAEYEIWNYKDNWNGDFDKTSLKKDIQRVLKETNFKKIVTHNLTGEYGHTQHIALSKIVHKLVKENLFTFALSKKVLDLDLLQKKLQLLSFYKSQDINWLKKYIVYEGSQKIK